MKNGSEKTPTSEHLETNIMNERTMPIESICTSASEFQMQVQEAQIDGEGGVVIVSDELFRRLSKGKPTPYITYGSPGVKVYPPNKKEQCDLDELKRVE